MALQTDLATLAQVRAYLEIQSTDTEQDAVLSALITRASRWIERYTDRYFGSDGTVAVPVVRYFNGNGRRRMTFRTEIQSVSDLSIQLYEGAPTYDSVPQTPLPNYFLEPVERPQGFPYQTIEFAQIPRNTVTTIFTPGHRTVKITGVWGWAAIPEDVQESCIQLVAAIHKRRLAGPSDTLAQVQGGVVIIGKYIPEILSLTLQGYRRQTIASSGD